MKAKSCVLVVSLVACLLVVCHAKTNFEGLTGPYCATRYRERVCCAGRQDDCSVPILGTLCYCDDFCRNRTRDEDCCPDYASFCKGEAEPGPLLNRDCVHNGKVYYFGNKFQENCNKCKCGIMDGKSEPEIICETNTCLMDEDIIDNVNGFEDFSWRAENYSQFWGHTLNEGLKLRLGTINPSKSFERLGVCDQYLDSPARSSDESVSVLDVQVQELEMLYECASGTEGHCGWERDALNMVYFSKVYKMNSVRRIYNPADLPRTFDARDQWPDNITPVHDQGWCAASWALSTVDVASDRFAIMSKGSERVELSAQHLLSCNSRGQQGCKGGYLDRAWLFMRKFGLTDEDCYPWVGRINKCKIMRKAKLSDSGCKKRNSYTLTNEPYKVGPAYRLGNETDIMQEILTSGPVQATMRVYQDFFHYSGGIYHHFDNSKSFESGYHSVRIVGWGETIIPPMRTPMKYWIVANSWGKEWGNDGYFNIIRGSNECEIESFVLGVWAKTV